MIPIYNPNQVALVIPTLNAAGWFEHWSKMWRLQRFQPSHCLVMDSSSTDMTCALFRSLGFEIVNIAQSDFRHGATRQQAVDLLPPEVQAIIFMTQDAILADENALLNLVCALDDPEVAAAYGRQLPHQDASPVASHARLYNYPEISHTKALADKEKLGLKVAFCSNSFAIYRRLALQAVGGFASQLTFGEDMHAAGRLLIRGWLIKYCAEARVHHSHNEGLAALWQRYRAIGQFHREEAWLLESFGNVSGEGKKYALAEMYYALRHAPHWAVISVLHTATKWLAYRAGVKGGRRV